MTAIRSRLNSRSPAAWDTLRSPIVYGLVTTAFRSISSVQVSHVAIESKIGAAAYLCFRRHLHSL